MQRLVDASHTVCQGMRVSTTDTLNWSNTAGGTLCRLTNIVALTLRVRRHKHGDDSPVLALQVEVREIECIAENLPLVLFCERGSADLELDYEDQIVREENHIGTLSAAWNIELEKERP